MSNKLRGKSLLLVGFTLFSMFFGAGNLIFPPFLGAEAGQNAWAALAGFAVSAIGLPIAGVIAVARAGSLGVLASRVHPRFALVFTMLIYLSIGPCLAIPRTASTSFQMLAPFIGSEGSHQLLYSAVFFAAAFAVALHPEKLTDRLGRVLCPTLIVLILVLFGSCLVHPVAPHYASPAAEYQSLPALSGILNGYQTMDTLAALNFGAVIALNIRTRGIDEEGEVRRGTISAGLIAMFLGVMIAYVIQKIKPRGKTVLEIISILPYSIPGIVLAIGVILSWSGAFGINLYNTLWIILVAYIARYLAFSMKSASASLQQVHYSLEDAARTCGATHFESLTDVTLPLIRPAMISGFFLIFLPAMRELTTSVLLYGPYTRTLGVAIYSLRSDGYIVDSSALASLAIVLIIICNTVVNAILKDRKKV